MTWMRIKTVTHEDIFMGGSYASIKRQKKQNAVTSWVSLVILGPPWVCDMPILDSDEVDENKKPSHIRIFLWEGHMLEKENCTICPFLLFCLYCF